MSTQYDVSRYKERVGIGAIFYYNYHLARALYKVFDLDNVEEVQPQTNTPYRAAFTLFRSLHLDINSTFLNYCDNFSDVFDRTQELVDEWNALDDYMVHKVKKWSVDSYRKAKASQAYNNSDSDEYFFLSTPTFSAEPVMDNDYENDVFSTLCDIEHRASKRLNPFGDKKIHKKATWFQLPYIDLFNVPIVDVIEPYILDDLVESIVGDTSDIEPHGACYNNKDRVHEDDNGNIVCTVRSAKEHDYSGEIFKNLLSYQVSQVYRMMLPHHWYYLARNADNADTMLYIQAELAAHCLQLSLEDDVAHPSRFSLQPNEISTTNAAMIDELLPYFADGSCVQENAIMVLRLFNAVNPENSLQLPMFKNFNALNQENVKPTNISFSQAITQLLRFTLDN